MPFKTLCAASIAALAFAAPAQAQQITAFTEQNVLKALQNIGVQGATAETVNGPQGPTSVIRFEAMGLKHNAALEACQTAAGCLGLTILTVWNGVTPDLNVVNEFNIGYSFPKAVAGPSDLAIARYAIADGGVSMKYLESNIGNHVNFTQIFMEYYQNAVGASTVSLKTNASAAKELAAAPGLAGMLPLLAGNDFAAPAQTPTAPGAHAPPR